MDISSALTTATATLSLVKSIKELDHALDGSELKAKMADLYGDLADVKIALVDAQQILNQKDTEIENLKAALVEKKELFEMDGYQYQTDVNGEPTGLPVCPIYLVKEGIQIRMVDLLGITCSCPNCSKKFGSLPEF